jgi:hypothetical protein
MQDMVKILKSLKFIDQEQLKSVSINWKSHETVEYIEGDLCKLRVVRPDLKMEFKDPI